MCTCTVLYGTSNTVPASSIKYQHIEIKNFKNFHFHLVRVCVGILFCTILYSCVLRTRELPTNVLYYLYLVYTCIKKTKNNLYCKLQAHICTTRVPGQPVVQ